MHLLKRHRLAKGWSQTELARRVEVTVNGKKKTLSVATISAYESRRRRPASHIYPKLARALGIDPMELTKIIEPDYAAPAPAAGI